ncbi:inclusion body family protein [Acidithiobacillus sp. IBUN Pt1247-S3]|uniref:inclusion body family protein n=1 Tax=Acidithiobacillus sp. IBUN Pt1247-S3 TaxID=3166642 RepID=UPI0034E4C56D
MSSPELESSAEQINVLIVIDTDYVKVHYQNPSKDPNNPTGIDHNSQFMICTDPRGGIVNQGTADLQFTALPGDLVSFAGVSIYDNSDDAVVVYGIKYWKGDSVFNQFVPNLVRRNGAAQPDTNTSNGLPVLNVPQNFTSFDSKVKQSGTENFYVQFGLYQLVDGENQRLFGYFYWDPSICVK